MNVVVTCEHASCAVPGPLRGLGLPRESLSRHIGWDPGALPVARVLARGLAAPLFAGRWSRLVADLNRSADHPRVIAATTDGRVIPGNAALDDEARAARLRRYWRPYRERVAAALAAAARRGRCIHFSVHSFVERLHGVERTSDIGLLFDPARPRERELVTAMQRHLRASGLSVRKNFPYFGHTDGVTTATRAVLSPRCYLGIEIELNQRSARTPAGQRRFAAALLAAIGAALGEQDC